jgi:prepilin-type N-terminal cleavage/methylation domain-containing protein
MNTKTESTRTRAPKAGFTLIELMIVVAIIAIIAAIAIPNLLRSRMSSNEAAAIGGIRTISTAETMFQSSAFVDADGNGMGDYGTLAQLADPDGGGATEPFIDAVLGSGNKLGYQFAAVVTPGNGVNMPSYTCTAVPSAPGRTGLRTFFVDDSGVIRFTSDGTVATVASPELS